MSNYYILSIDSFQDTFTKIDATTQFSFMFSTQNSENIFHEVHTGDHILIYRKAPLSGVNMYMKVLSNSGTLIRVEKRVEVSKIVTAHVENVDLETEYLTEISKGLFESICKSLVSEIYEASDNEELDDVQRITGGENILIYGVPGVGKSHEIQEKYCNDETKIERVVFHPDYSYSDFIGQILPRVDNGQLKYVFTPGPFTKILKKAWDNPGEKWYLIIEEINRGNAPAIFGEIFQLLDRKTEDNDRYDSTEYGESEYGISNYDIASVVYGENNDNMIDHSIRIPSNLWVLATMNTADQNVFTLDTAFQRRWNMHHIKNDISSAIHAEKKIEGSDISWGAFAAVINDMVVDINVDIASSEDKRLGAYFVKQNELTAKKFPEKVLKYLWDDAFKMDKEKLFDEQFKSLESVIDTYNSATEDKLEAVLKPDVYQKMLSTKNYHNE